MFFVLSKLLHFFFMPLSWVFILLALSFLWKRRARKLRLIAIVLLYIFSNPFIMNEVSRAWETPIVMDEAMDNYKVGVVLGGFSSYNEKADRITFRYAADRLLQALRLLETGKIKQLAMSGGSGYVMRPDLREGVFVTDYLNEINVPRRKILLDSFSRNTRENAVQSAALLRENRLENEPIVLITSAFHMPRAKACFEKEGLTVIPFPTDPLAGDRKWYPDFLLLPHASVLAQWNVLIHEWVGYVSYWIMGYV